MPYCRFLPVSVDDSGRLNLMFMIDEEEERRRKKKKDWFIIKSTRSKILNCVIIYKLQIYYYKYNSLKFY